MKVWLLVLLLAYTQVAYSDAPFAVHEVDGTRIELYREKCKLPDVENLPHHAVWTEKGVVFTGCWGHNPNIGIVLSYWSDKTVTAIPAQVFRKVTGV